ncbi:hypothetical protein M5C99_19165 [Acidovorax sp. NCPPB 2350]|nr:hypothetical protein M5C99_19165 [Acidovorax sp. NCPPB 2350]
MPDLMMPARTPEPLAMDAGYGNTGHMPWQWHVGAIALFSLLTAGLFAHRWVGVDISSVYSMPDVDTDGTLWFIWLKVHTGHIFSSMRLADALTYPFGYDLSPFPFDNFLDDVRALCVSLSGGTWRDLIRVINISALIAYPLSAYTMYLLCWHLTRQHFAALLAAIIFAFSGYFLMLSRGSMSNNHFWLLPLVYLFFFRYLECRSLRYLALSCMLNAVQFGINPYWAFYGWIFTPIILLMQPAGWRDKLNQLMIYCAMSGLFLFLLNIQFVRQQWFLLTNPVQSNLVRPAGGLENAIFQQGVPLVPGIGSKIYGFSAPVDVGAFLGYSLLGAIGWACFFGKAWRIKYWAALFACFALAVVLSSNFPALIAVNHVYFFFFDMFRGVSRVVQLASFLGAILLAMVFAKWRGKTLSKAFLAVAMCCFYLWEVFPGSPTVTQRTDFGQVASLYEDLAQDDQITAIASYPMVYSNVSWGTAPLFEALGQIVHHKPIAGGKDLRVFRVDPEARPIYGEIGESQTIANLADHGINRIVIYNRVLENASAVNAELAADRRLQLIGRRQVPERECGTSLLCRSLDITVYAIKSVKPVESPMPLPGL